MAKLICAIAITACCALAAAEQNTASPAARSAAASTVDVPHWHQLPTAVRRDLPPLKLALLRWHPDPDERFVFLNDRRIGEDGVVGQELWVREIRPDGVVMEFRTTHFWLPR